MRRVLLTALLGAATAFAQHPEADEGQKLFVKLCSACHGVAGKGGRGPDLTTGQWKHGGSAEDLERSITKGIPGTEMAAFPMPAADARAVVSFLRSISGTVDEQVAGDPEEGRASSPRAAADAICTAARAASSGRI